MCFGGSSSPPKPVPTYAARFEYNRPVPKPNEQQGPPTTNTTPAFGSELGTSTTATPSPTGGY